MTRAQDGAPKSRTPSRSALDVLALLGPQRLAPAIADELDALSVDGPVAAVTAGWQEREAEDEELRAHIARPVTDLRLHARCEAMFAEDPELFEAHRGRQKELRALQRLYRFRLDFVLEPARQLIARNKGPRRWLQVEQDAAIAAVRTLDHEHLVRVQSVNDAFEARWKPLERLAVARQRDEIAAILNDAQALLIAGGHVAVLLNRMRLLGIAALIGTKPVVAWSAGAMVLTERIVLFHDSPPQGFGNAEVLENGLGLAPGVVALPHARHRLRLDDPVRASLLARRFAPAVCVPLDEESRLRSQGGPWSASDGTQRIALDGTTPAFHDEESAP